MKKSKDGIELRGGRMEGTDESTELWQHPNDTICFTLRKDSDVDDDDDYRFKNFKKPIRSFSPSLFSSLTREREREREREEKKNLASFAFHDLLLSRSRKGEKLIRRQKTNYWKAGKTGWSAAAAAAWRRQQQKQQKRRINKLIRFACQTIREWNIGKKLFFFFFLKRRTSFASCLTKRSVKRKTIYFC